MPASRVAVRRHRVLFLLVVLSALWFLPGTAVWAQQELFGIWTGTWMSGFGSGTMTMDVASVDDIIQATVTLTGTIFANPGPHAPFVMTGSIDGENNLVLSDPDNPIYGPLTITIDSNGVGTANAPNVPSPLIDSATGTGQLNQMDRTAMGTGTPTPNFGGDANSTFTLALTTPAAPPATRSILFAQVGEGESGNINFSTQFAMDNTTDATATLTLEFFATPNGSPMPVNLVGHGTASTFNFVLDPGETLFLQTPGTTTPIQVGYARANVSEGVSGTAIFTRVDDGVKVTKAGIPASIPLLNFTVPVDTRGANDIGLALVDCSLCLTPAAAALSRPAGGAQVTLRLYDADFELLGTRMLSFSEGSHMAAFVTQEALFGSVGGVGEMTGSMTVESNRLLAAAVLLQDDDPALQFPSDVPILTAFPVIQGSADTAAAGASIDVQEQVLRATVEVPRSGRPINGAVYRLYQGKVLLGRFLRAIPASRRVIEVFNLPQRVDLAGVSATVQFIFDDGTQGDESPLPESALRKTP